LGGANERGIALITSLLVLMLISALLVGFTTVIVSDQRYRIIDRDRGQAFYAAAGAIEKQTVDLGNLFLNNVSPTNAQVTALTATGAKPVITNVTFTAANAATPLVASELSTYDCNNSDGVARAPVTVGTNGYTIMFCGLTATNNPTTLPAYNVVQTGTFAGLMALKTPYQMDVTAQTSTGGEAHLIRTMEAVSIPVFQFGIFSTVDLAFNAADNFSFGGRVHTNGNLFLSEGSAGTLTLSDKVDAYGQVVRQVLSNGVAITANSDTGPVNMTKGSGTYRALAATEGSVVAGPASASNDPTWTSLSLGTYKGYIIDKETGAHQLHLPLVSAGGQDIQLVQRPAAGELTTSFIYGERLFNKASIRVMLSDTSAEITNIPGIDNTVAPTSLEAGAGPFGGIPVALSPGPLASTPALTATVGAGTNKTLTMAAVPAFLGVTLPITGTSGANQWTITACSTKTTTTFTGCSIAVVGGAPTTMPVGTILTAAGVNGVATTVAMTTGAGKTITVAAGNTMGFSMNTFWIDDEVVTCSGLTTTTLTGCTLASGVTSGDKIQNFATMNAGTSVLGGFIKIERQNAADSTWHDITAEILG
jgi:Tfp pilus assembly protein PilX